MGKYVINLKGLGRAGASGYRVIGMKQVGDQIRKNVLSIVWESQILEQSSDPRQGAAVAFIG